MPSVFHYEYLESLSLSASEDVVSLSQSLIIPLRRKTGEARGTSGDLGERGRQQYTEGNREDEEVHLGSPAILLG
jgi:hypothetical protein